MNSHKMANETNKICTWQKYDTIVFLTKSEWPGLNRKAGLGP